jgi:SAM-dependent methyltransferase
MNEARLAAWELAMRRHPIPVGAVLDVGCSYGSWADNWKRLGFTKLLGAEPNAVAAENARASFDSVVNCYSFDVHKHFPINPLIASNGVIVHIVERAEEERFLRDLAGCLAQDGYFLFAVVNARFYLSPVGRRPWVGPNSCTRWLEEHEEIARRAGLRVVDVIGTFVNPWFCDSLDFIASDKALVDDWGLYEGLLRFSAPLRGRSRAPFAEALVVAQKA